MNDFYYWDIFGFGVGVENIDLGFGKLFVVVICNIECDGVFFYYYDYVIKNYKSDCK